MESPGRYSVNSENFSDMLSRIRDEDAVDEATDVIDLIRAKWISQRVKDRHAEFTDVKKHTFLVTSYNLNGKSPSAFQSMGVDFNDWLFKDGDVFPDFFVIGFQEMVDLNAANVVLNLESGKRAREWNPLLLAVVNARASHARAQCEYFEVATHTLCGVHILVLAKVALRPFIRSVHRDNAAVGIGGVLGNKGGSAVRFRLHDSTFCFVCSHLAAHRNAVGARNANVFSIVDKLSLRGHRRANTVTPTTAERGGGSLPFFVDVAQAKEIHPFDHDYVVWLGDLNYRIDASLSVEAVNELVDARDYAVLRDMDQLNMEREDGRVFEGFLEGVLDFPPTYKYNPKTDDYERRAEKKQRAAAWCDRVLWKDSRMAYGPGGAHSIELKSYGCSRIITSDHKPVLAHFDVGVSKVSADKYQRIIGELTRELDAEENSAIPKCELDMSSIELGELRFYERREIKIKIRNVGTSMATFRFVPKFGEDRFSKRWIMVASDSVGGLLKAGDTGTITIRFEVNATTIRDVDLRTGQLADILILRVLNGADSFVAVSGTLKSTCFGKPLDELLLEDEAAVAAGGGGADEADAGPPLLIPRYVWQLCDMVFFQCNLETPCLFRKAASLAQKRAICDWLEHPLEDTDVDHCDINAYLAVFADFLMALHEPVIPRRLLPTGPIDAAKLQTWCKELLEALDVASYNLFMYVVSFLRELLRHQQENLLDTQHAARVATSFLAQIPISATKRIASSLSHSSAGYSTSSVSSAAAGHPLVAGGGGGAASQLGRRGVSAHNSPRGAGASPAGGGGGGGGGRGRLLSGGKFDAAGAAAGGPDLSVAYEQLCVAMEYFLAFDGASVVDTAGGGSGSGDIARQLAAEAAAFDD